MFVVQASPPEQLVLKGIDLGIGYHRVIPKYLVERQEQDKKHRILLVESHVCQLAKHQSNQRRRSTARNHGQRSPYDVLFIGWKISEQSEQLRIA